MARVSDCVWERSWVADDGVSIGALAKTPCEYDNYSSRIYQTGPAWTEGDESLMSERPDYEAVRRFDGGYTFLYEVVDDGGNPCVGDELYPTDEYTWMFRLS